jgi:hypothetical protein
MTSKHTKQSERFQLRKWTRKRLTEADFSFAISSKRDEWDSLTHHLWKSERVAAKKVVADMLDWEIWREFEGNTSPPFLSVKEHEERISSVLDLTTLPKDSQLEPLKNVSLPDAAKRNNGLSSGVDEGVRVHAFEIERDEPTEVTVKRFRNWLVQHKRTLLAQYARPGSGHTWIAAVKGRFANRGRLSFDAALRALAVRRLKMAGFSREEAERKLQLKRYALFRPDSWSNSRLIALAERTIHEYREMFRKIFLP